MGEFEKLKVVTRYELLKQFRRKRFHGALAITVLAMFLMIGLYQGLNLPRQIGISGTILGQWGPEIFAIFVTNIGALAALAAVFLSGDAIVGEFERKTGYILFPNPVKRTTIIIGKYLACFLASAAILSVGYVMAAVAVLAFYGTIPVGVLGSLAVTLMFICFMISLAFAFSSVLKGSMGATIAALLAFWVVLTTITTALIYAGYDPWFMPDRAQETMSFTYGVPAQAFAGMLGGGQWMGGIVQASQDPVLGFLVLLAYAVVLFGVSLWVAKRREMI